MTTSYDRDDLIAAVVREIDNIIFSYSDDPEIEYVDFRLQLVDNTYYVHIGDNQYDDDHRGIWSDGSISTSNCDLGGVRIKTEYTEEEIQSMAEEIVDDALDELET